MNNKSPNLVKLIRSQKLGSKIIGRLWRSGNGCIWLSEVSDNLELDGVALFDTRYVRAIKNEFEEKHIYSGIIGNQASAIFSRTHLAIECDSFFSAFSGCSSPSYTSMHSL